MKKLNCSRFILVSGLVVSLLLTGCSSGIKAPAGDNAESVSETLATSDAVAASESEPGYTDGYEYVFRKLSEPVYMEAAESFSGGEGTAESPYEISTPQELQLLADLLNGKNGEEEGKDYRDRYYVLTADIALNDSSDFNNWENKRPQYDWEPMGRTTAFTGVFDGNGHTVSGMYIDADQAEGNVTDNAYGLFANNQGTIKNLNIVESYIAVSGYSVNAGAIAGQTYGGEIAGCSVDALLVSFDGTVGGIAGQVFCTDITDCSFRGLIKEAKDTSYSKLGGILGSVSGDSENIADITGCSVEGELRAAAGSAQSMGGIAGTISSGVLVKDCAFDGKCDGTITGDVSDMPAVGGIAGTVSLSAAGDGSTSYIRNCSNNGGVYGSAFAGGIVGNGNFSDSRFEKFEIRDCINKGTVSAPEGAVGGIAGQMYCNGGGFILSGCINEADFDEGQAAAGIAYQISQMKGEAVVENCVNNGRIASDGQYAGGIITYIPNLGDEWHITVDGCKNTADISSAQHVGGIVCFNFYDHQEGTSDTSMTITNCENSGSLSSSSTNAYIGGILAVDGLKTTPVQISHCTNTGSISFTEPMVIDQEMLDSKELFAFSVTAGGIVGRIGESLFLTTDADSVDASSINGDEALVTIEDCHSSGSIQCEDIQFEAEPEEGREEWMERYWQENLGGILGTSSCTDGFTVRVTDCTYKGVSRGMGSEELPDVGTKED